jgi:hypothetical protein
MNFKPELLALLIILAFGVILYLVIRMSRKSAAEKSHQIQTLGFEELSDLPSRLASRAEDTFKRQDQKAIYIDGIFSKKEADRELFIFNISDSNDEDNEMGTEVFGMISSELSLPRFSLTTLPGFINDSLLGGIMDALLDKVLALAEKYQGMIRIEFPDKPGFDNQAVVFGSEETAVRELLRGIHLSTIQPGQAPIHIAGCGDFLTVDFSLPSSYSSDENDLISQYQQFIQITRSFRN